MERYTQYGLKPKESNAFMARIDGIVERYDKALERAEDATIRRINRALEGAYRELERDTLNAYRRHSQKADLLPNERRLLIMDEISSYRILLNPSEQQQIEADFQNLLRGSYQDGLTMADDLSRAIANESLRAFSTVPLEAIRQQAQNSAARLYRHTAEMQDRISGLVEINLATGRGPRPLAAQLREQLGIVKGRAESIARTETLSALNDAAKARYNRSGIEYVQWLASGGNICPYCVSRHGNAYKISEVRMPLHPRCRCVLLPYKKEWAEDGLIDEQLFLDGYNRRAEELKRETGKEPNQGIGPFERAAGLTSPPTPIWTIRQAQ